MVDPDSTRDQLLDAAARMLAEHGTDALTTRRLAAAVGMSTMSVYTHFGGKPELMRALYLEGFDRFGRRLTEAGTTDDPLADLARLSSAYRGFALENPNFYDIMFGQPASRFKPTVADREHAMETLSVLINGVARCVEAGLIAGEPFAVALQIWAAVHGVMSLELATQGELQVFAGGAVYDELVQTVIAGLRIRSGQ